MNKTLWRQNMSKVFFRYLEHNNAELFTIVFLPQDGAKYPTVIIRSPYVDSFQNLSEEEICRIKSEEYQCWLENNYAVVFQHCRGRGKSTGDCIPYINERDDGLFLQDWIRNQPFYNGELYLWGGSYTAAVHFVTSPFAEDIKGAVLLFNDCERYNSNYRNGFFKMGLHGSWYVGMYKNKTLANKNYTPESFNILPLSNFSKTVFGESAKNFDEVLKHPNKNDDFWKTHAGGFESHDAIKHANIPILLLTGFYDIFTGGVFDMWNSLDAQTKSKSVLIVHPFDHDCNGNAEPINFENGNVHTEFGAFSILWLNSVRDNSESPFKKGKVTYYKLFDNKWHCDDFNTAKQQQKISLGNGKVSYKYNPDNPATFKGGLSANFGGNAWQDEPGLRDDIITVYTPEFAEDTFVKGKIKAKLKVKSDCEDTCFYIRISLCKNEGYYGIRDDINQISNFDDEYVPNTEIYMDFSFDDHAFVIKKGEKLRIDISSSAFPHYVRHTNNKGLFSEQTETKIADNTVILGESYIELPID
ncbi:MAG: CocE/NonD family hydrolase [Ruminococcaceae bacterium]|nr:CocE/NonD family hydrolase [Oscillospiraceae bacterium]